MLLTACASNSDIKTDYDHRIDFSQYQTYGFFNPLGIETPDTELSLEEREIGGLGIHLIRKMMDRVSYQRRIEKNVISVVKSLN